MVQSYTGASDAEVSAQADAQKNQLVAQGNPGYTEIRRRGQGWSIMVTTAPTALVAIPTTLAHLEVYNNGSRLIVVSDLHLYRLLGSAVVEGECIFAMISTQKAIPAKADLVMYSLSGKASITTTVNSEVGTGVGTTVIANGWMPYGAPTARTLGAATSGTGQSIPIDGKLIVPPGCSLCLAGVSSANTATCLYVGVTFDLVSATVEA